MSEFFKQLIQQLSTLWGKLSGTQKVVLSSVLIFSFVGLVSLVVWSSGTGDSRGFSTLYANLDLEESGSILDALREAKVEFKVEGNGSSILVPTDKLYEMRMQLAKLGLPKSGHTGYEIFDKTSLGQTDFVQKLNYMRALEGELAKTIQSLDEVQKARVHIVVPKPTLFTDKVREPTASVVLKIRAGSQLDAQKGRAVSHLVAAAVEGLKARYITVVDVSGRLLSNPYGDDELADRSTHQIEIQQSVEKYLENKVVTILEGVLGPNRSQTKVAVTLDFEQVEKNIETFNPESKVVRSEERNEEQTTNSPQGDNRKDNSITNYEIDKTVQHIVNAVGSMKRLSVSVAVDGHHKINKNGEDEYKARSSEEIAQLEGLVRSAVGLDNNRGDQIVVANVQFDKQYFTEQLREMEKEEKWARYQVFAKYGLILVAIILFLLFARYLAQSIVEALNPPVPEYARAMEDEAVPDVIPDHVQRSNEMMQRVEMLVKQEPLNVAQIIRTWLMEGRSQKKHNDSGKAGKGKKE